MLFQLQYFAHIIQWYEFFAPILEFYRIGVGCPKLKKTNVILDIGGTITVSGSNFGPTGTVSVGDVNASIVSYTGTEVVFEVSGLSAGAQYVKVGNSYGFALYGLVQLRHENICFQESPLGWSQTSLRLKQCTALLGNISSHIFLSVEIDFLAKFVI